MQKTKHRARAKECNKILKTKHTLFFYFGLRHSLWEKRRRRENTRVFFCTCNSPDLKQKYPHHFCKVEIIPSIILVDPELWDTKKRTGKIIFNQSVFFSCSESIAIESTGFNQPFGAKLQRWPGQHMTTKISKTCLLLLLWGRDQVLRPWYPSPEHKRESGEDSTFSEGVSLSDFFSTGYWLFGRVFDRTISVIFVLFFWYFFENEGFYEFIKTIIGVQCSGFREICNVFTWSG